MVQRKEKKKITVIIFLPESVEEVCSSARLHHSTANQAVVLSSFLDVFADSLCVLYGVIIIDTLEQGRGEPSSMLAV